MAKYNPENEIVKKKYYEYLHESKGRAISTVDGARKTILRYEEFTGFCSFKSFDSEKAMAFKKHLLKDKNKNGEQLSLSTVHNTLNPLKDFLLWLGRENGFKRAIQANDIDYLNLTNKDRRKLQTARKPKEFPTIEQIQAALAFNPKNDVEMRDRAMIALLASAAVRHDALISLKLKHLNLKRQAIIQDPNEVNTKNSKWINSYLINIGDGIKQVVIDWGRYLQEELLFDGNDPLFPQALVMHDEFKQFSSSNKLDKKHITTQAPLVGILRKHFAAAGLQYYKPHSFRDMQTDYMLKNGTMEEFVAFSLNLGHENPSITVGNYYSPSPEQQFKILSKVNENKGKSEMDLQTALQVIQSNFSNK